MPGCLCLQVQQGRRRRRSQRLNLITHGVLTRQLHAVVESAKALNQLADSCELASRGTDHTMVPVQGGDCQLASQVPDLHAPHYPPLQRDVSSAGDASRKAVLITLHCARSAGPKSTTTF